MAVGHKPTLKRRPYYGAAPPSKEAPKLEQPPTFYTSGLCAAGATNPADSLIKALSSKQIDDDIVSVDKPRKIGFFSLFRYATSREKALLILGTTAAAVSGLSMPIWLILLGESLETFNQIGAIIAAGGSYDILLDEMIKLIYSFAIVGGVSLVCGTVYVAIWSYVGNVQTLRIRKAFVRKALRQEAAWFDTHVGDPQELPVLAANSLGRIEVALGRAVPDTFSNLLSAVGCLAVSFGLDAPLALFMLCILPVIGVCVGVVGCFMRKTSGLALKEFASAGAFASEVLTGIKTVASLRAEKWAVERYSASVMQAQRYSVKSQVYAKLAAALMRFLFYVTYTFAFIFGTYQAAERAEKEATMFVPFACYFGVDCGIHGSYVMVCIYGVVLTAQFIALMNPGLNAISLGQIAASEIYSTIERTPEIDGTNDMKGVKLDDSYDGSIEMKHVIFAYPSRPSTVIFNDFHLKIEAGSSVALVGPSGSGKSSLSKLLLRLYDPIGGKILIGRDRIPLTEMNVKSWREQIGYVSQEPNLFPGTIRYNIASGSNGTATDEEVQQAAKSASAHDFIMDLPDGYNTFYSGSSMQLSGGQIQRICIARALIRNPKILLLDEATSALDTASEKVVQDALEKIRSERKLTTVTVAHRLSTIVNSDKIVVIADGDIQECGTHTELLAEDGIYATLCEGQGITADSANQSNGQTNGVVTTSTNNIAAPKINGTLQDVEAGATTDKEEDVEESYNYKEINSRLREFTQVDFWYTLMGYIGGIFVGVLPACEAVLFGSITGNFFIIEDADEMRAVNTRLSLWFLLLAAISFMGNMAMGSGFGVSGCRLTRRLRTLVFGKIMRYSMGFFDLPEHSVGELTTGLEQDSESASNVTGLQQGQRIQTFTCLIAGMVVALYYSWQIGLIAIACVPLIIGAGIIRAKYGKREVTASTGSNFVSPATLLERSFHDIVVLQAYGHVEIASDKYSASLEPDVEFKKKQSAMDGLSFGASQFSVFGVFAIIFWAGIKLMLNGMLGFTDFFVALLAIMFSSFGAGQTGADFSAKKRGVEAAGRLFVIADDEVEEDMDPFSDKGEKPSSLNGKIIFEHCHFAYPTRANNPIYYKRGERDGFSLDIEAKQTVAFTGKSGCGKSTALQLLLRFYRVNQGSISLDDYDLMKLNLGWLREQIGYVGQMPVLFEGSVKDNLLLGKPDATEKEITAACRAANAHDFITKLSSGYDTNIGVGGMLLSGGQRQRIAIARAVVKNPQMLVLDEATAALDNESERVVQAALDKMHADSPRTTLVVAHRLETIKNCDKIVVLDRGGVKEEGSHSELLEMKGVYHGLWMKQ